jgi:hypothetical protein
MHLALRNAEVDAVKSDDLAKGLGEPARANCKPRRSGRYLPDRRVAMLFGCRPETRQFESELGM